jgi:hypothetical protein
MAMYILVPVHCPIRRLLIVAPPNLRHGLPVTYGSYSPCFFSSVFSSRSLSFLLYLSLWISSSAVSGIRHPTSVAAKESRIVGLHRSSATRSRILSFVAGMDWTGSARGPSRCVGPHDDLLSCWLLWGAIDYRSRRQNRTPARKHHYLKSCLSEKIWWG